MKRVAILALFLIAGCGQPPEFTFTPALSKARWSFSDDKEWFYCDDTPFRSSEHPLGVKCTWKCAIVGGEARKVTVYAPVISTHRGVDRDFRGIVEVSSSSCW